MTSPAPACASDASLDENRIPFFFGPASLLIPFLIFALLSVYLFVVLKVFDLMALAGAGLTALVAGAVLTKKPMRYWKAVLEGAASPMTATVLLLLMAAGVFSAMMKAAGLAEALAAFTGGAIAGTPLLTPAVFLISSLLATATGSSISTILAASPIFLPFGAALGCDVPLMAGAILSGAIFGDNLAPVSDVAIISAMTQTDKFGKPLDLGRVVKTRFPFAVIALIIALPFYALGGRRSQTSAPAQTKERFRTFRSAQCRRRSDASSDADPGGAPHLHCDKDARRTPRCHDGNRCRTDHRSAHRRN